MRLLNFILLLILSINVSWGYTYDAGLNTSNYKIIDFELQNQQYDGISNLCYRCTHATDKVLQEKAQDGSFFAFEVGFVASKGVDPRKLQSRQGRSEMTPKKTRKFTKAMQKDGFGDFPKVDVFDVDGDLIINDGHHRVRAAVQAGLNKVPVNVQKVTNEAQKSRLKKQVFDAKIN